MLEKILNKKLGSANIIVFIIILLVLAMFAAAIYTFVLLTNETTFIDNLCEIAVKKAFSKMETTVGMAGGRENVISENLVNMENQIQNELLELFTDNNISMSSIDVSFNGRNVEIKGTATFKTQNPFGQTSVKTINFTYKGRFAKNFGE